MESREDKAFEQKHTNFGTSTTGISQQESTTDKGGLKNNFGEKLQQFSSATADKFNHLSTTQKVVGGSLLALGAGWVTMSAMHKNPSGKVKATGRKLKDSSSKFFNKDNKKSA